MSVHSNYQLSIIIPAFNERECIGSTIGQLQSLEGNFEIIVVDGGSRDGTVELCQAIAAVRVYSAPESKRATQMNLGAQHARGEYLLFLHADTTPPRHFYAQICAAIQTGAIGGAFGLRFDQRHWVLSLIAAISTFNQTRIVFGDHGIFVTRDAFRRCDGYLTIPIMEDLELVQRLRQLGHLVKLPSVVTTSARRFVETGVLYQALLDLAILLAFLCGISPVRLSRWYSYSN